MFNLNTYHVKVQFKKYFDGELDVRKFKYIPC